MICQLCGKEFKQTHYNQRYCSEECRKEAKRQSKKKYKQSAKGKISNEKWLKSDRRKENERKYRQKPIAKEKAVLRAKKYLNNHPEAIAKKRQRDKIFGRTEKGREINRRAQRKYKKTEKGRLNNRKQKFIRRTLKPANQDIIKDILQNNICYYCNKEIIGKKTIDHKIPVSKGGTNDKENLVLCCVHCNSQKGNKTEEEYKKWLKLQ